jgi:hypothetical protein
MSSFRSKLVVLSIKTVGVFLFPAVPFVNKTCAYSAL